MADDKDQKNDVSQHDKKDDVKDHMVPKSRLDSEIEKRKGAESELKDIAEELKADIPEEFKDLIPDLPPSKLIKWIRNANAKGLFDPKNENDDTKEIDKKRPSSKKAEDLDSLSPYAKIARGSTCF